MRLVCPMLAVITGVSIAGAAHAQAFRTYLASYGADTNPCSITQPCRLLPAALNAVADGGEIWILDSANFNTATVHVQKSVSILAVPGQVGSILAVSGTAAMVLDPPATSSPPSIRVGLRNAIVTSNVNSPGGTGIVVSNGADLSVEESLFANLPGVGIAASNTVSVIHAKNTVFRNLAAQAISAQNGPVVNLTHSRLISTNGVLAYNTAASTTTEVNVTDSNLSDGSTALWIVASAGTARGFLTRSTIHGVNTGLDVQSGAQGVATLTMGSSAVVGNHVGFAVSGAGGAIRSLGNNVVDGNDANTGALTSLAPQ